MEDCDLQKAQELLEDLSKGVAGSELGISTSKGLKVIAAHKGFFLCHFVVPDDFLEEIEIEAKAVKERGRLRLHAVEIRRKSNGKLISLCQRWMTSIGHGQESSSRL